MIMDPIDAYIRIPELHLVAVWEELEGEAVAGYLITLYENVTLWLV